MKSFSEFVQFLTEAVRTGLPSIHSSESGNPMDHNQLHSLIHTGTVHINDVTEKTDGSVFHVGHDEHGFYTKYSGSGEEKMRSKEDYHTRAKRRAQETGKEYNPNVAEGFGKFHEALAANKGLQKHLSDTYKRTGKETVIKGEAFNRNMGEHHPDGTWQGAVTRYDTGTMGKHGRFVVHTKLPGNEDHQDIGKHSDSNLHIDDDKIKHTPTKVDVSAHAAELKGLNHDLLNSRTTKTNKEAKLAEQDKVSSIAKKVSDKVNDAVDKQHLKPKWSKEGNSEGFVVHPVGEQPRFKLISKEFGKIKKSKEYKDKWAAKK